MMKVMSQDIMMKILRAHILMDQKMQKNGGEAFLTELGILKNGEKNVRKKS